MEGLKLGLLGLSLVALVGCNTQNKAGNMNEGIIPKELSVTLNKEEKESLKDSKELILAERVARVAYNQASKEYIEGQENKDVQKVIVRAVGEYYIQREASKNVKVYEEDLKKVYETTKGQLQGKSYEEVKEAIYNLVYKAKLKQESQKIVKGMVDKYSLVDSTN